MNGEHVMDVVIWRIALTNRYKGPLLGSIGPSCFKSCTRNPWEKSTCLTASYPTRMSGAR